jgi:hypothetical protein
LITGSVIHRVFRTRIAGDEGTAFTVDVDGRQYLITAKHLANSIEGPQDVEIFANGDWMTVPIDLVGHADDVDISVLAPAMELTPPNLALRAGSRGIVYGQDVYFLGFPYGFLGRYRFGPHGYPMPFVKRAIVSLLDGKVFFLDGFNNPGFSGGPVVFQRPGHAEWSVAAVLTGYRYVDEPIFADDGPTPLTYRHNTGIIVSYAIEPALKLIADRPIGYVVAAAEGSEQR